MPTLDFTDAIENPSHRTTTANGYLVTSGVLARAGVYNYRAGELGLTDAKRKAEDMIAVFRSRAELEKAVDSFESQAIVFDHKWIDSRNWRAHAIGDVRDVEMQDDAMTATLIIRDDAAIRKISDGSKQLSNGYRAQLIPAWGSWQGQSYEYEQRDLVGNHVCVADQGRCGTACSIGDSAPCTCGRRGGRCTCTEQDPREMFRRRMEQAWKVAPLAPRPDDDQAAKPEADDDPRRSYMARQQNYWRSQEQQRFERR